MEEIWKDIKGYEGLYQVSNKGFVRRIHKDKRCNNLYRIISNNKNNKGYLCVDLWKNNIGERFFVHKLIIETFIDPKPFVNSVCRHLDGNQLNNNPNNLKWGTNKENSQDSIKHKTFQMGSKHYLAKLKEEDIPRIKQMIKDGLSNSKIGIIFNVNRQTIRDIRLNKTWKHIL